MTHVDHHRNLLNAQVNRIDDRGNGLEEMALTLPSISQVQDDDSDQRNNLATVSAYFDVWWLDEFLLWNATDYGGISKIFVPMKWIWKPEFYMYHSVYGRVPEYATDAPAEIRSDGRVRMFVSISSKSFCPINFKRFPFDSQTCSFSEWKLASMRGFECFEMFVGDVSMRKCSLVVKWNGLTFVY
ncbi:hypothetical protein COOONC_04691 [Cooperia oncophora]